MSLNLSERILTHWLGRLKDFNTNFYIYCNMKINSARQYALDDMRAYIRENQIRIMDDHNDVWFATPTYVSKHTKGILNNKLGLHKLNKQNNNQNFYGKQKNLHR